MTSNRRGKALGALLRSPFSLLHCLLCIAALIVGFRLSREAVLVVGSYKPSPDTFKSIDAVSQNEVALGFPYIKDDDRNLTQSVPSRMSSVGHKSSRVHVGRHEILIRSWPHPDIVHIFLAHQLLNRVQDEQQRLFGLKRRKQLLVITPTYVRTFQALHLTSLIYTLRAVPSPLVWIVVEAGGVSSETAALLVDSQLSYHHLGIDTVNILDGKHMRHVETLSRLEGLRFIGEQQLDGVVLFADDSNTYSSDYFDEAQKVHWVGFFSVGVLPPPGSPGLSFEIDESIQDQFSLSKEIPVGQGLDSSLVQQGLDDEWSAARALDTHFKGAITSFVREASLPMLALPLQAPVCNSSGHVIGWYSPSPSEKKGSGVALEWAGFALKSRIFWKDHERPIWIKSWTETLGQNYSLLASPLDFVRDASLVEPLGNCGKDVLMWRLLVEAHFDSRFPSRWMINPPLDVVVPSKHTRWPEPHLTSPPSPPSTSPPDFAKEHVSLRGKGIKGRKRKRRSHHAKHDKSKKVFFQVVDNGTIG